jgi:hypothetical protein
VSASPAEPESLPERRPPRNEAAIVILDGAGDDLRRARAVAVHQHHERQVLVLAVLLGKVPILGVVDAPVRVDDQLAALEEAIGDADRLIQRAAGVVAEIEHQTLHPFRRQVLQRAADFLVGRFRKISELDIAGLVVDHDRAADGGDVHLVALDREVDEAVVADPADGDVDFGPLGALQLADRFFAGPALGVLIVYSGDDVPAAQALPVGGRILEHRHHGDVAVDHLDLDAQAVVPAFLALAQLLILTRIEEVRMRIERLQHAVDRPVDQTIRWDLLDVFPVDRRHCRGEDPILLVDAVLTCQQAAAKEASGKGRQQDRKDDRGEQSETTHEGDRSRPNVTMATSSGQSRADLP